MLLIKWAEQNQNNNQNNQGRNRITPPGEIKKQKIKYLLKK